MSDDQILDTPTIAAEGQGPGEAKPVEASEGAASAPSGKRQALRDLRRQLSDEDLKSPGAQKLLLDELERSDADCELLKGYVSRFHEADKRAAVLEGQLRIDKAVEVAFGVGVGIGGTIIGLAPGLWTTPPYGPLAVAVGLVLMLGAIVARVVRR